MSSNPESSATVPSNPAASTHPERPLTARDREAADGLAQSLHAVYGILSDPVLTAGLYDRGFDMNEFQTGLTLQTAAEDVFATCQAALGALDRATAALEEAWVTAREDYLEFRSVARSRPRGVAPSELGVNGTVMPGFAAFVAQAGASYKAARASRFREPLACHGFDPKKLANLAEELVSLVALQEAVDRLRASVERQLDDRDLAIAMFNLWVRELLQQTRMVAGVTYRPPEVKAASHRVESWGQGLRKPFPRPWGDRPVPPAHRGRRGER